MKSVRHRSQTPECDRHRVADASAKAIDEPAHHQHAQGIRSLKRKYQVSILNLIPPKLML